MRQKTVPKAQIPKELAAPPETIEDCYRINDALIVALKERNVTPEVADQLSDISMLMAEFFRLRDLLGADQLDKILASEEFQYGPLRELNEKYEELRTIYRKRS